MSKIQIHELEEIIKYSFKNKDLLKLALTHSSSLPRDGRSKIGSNERLEFIGDGFLDAIIGAHLYELLPEAEEGELTKTRASIVCENSLARVGRENHINNYLLLGKGEEHQGGRERDSIIADSVEALIGAVYFDGGYEKAQELVLRLFSHIIKDGLEHKINKDYKSLLQEELQKQGTLDELLYELEKEEGPSHNKSFFVKLTYQGKVIGQGKGKKKKDAEQEAAKQALQKGGLL